MAKITNETEEQVLALLCGTKDPWTWGGSDGTCSISFERDGTGNIHCGENQRSCLAAEIHWSLAAEPIRVKKDSWTVTIQMSLTTRIPSFFRESITLRDVDMKAHLQSPPSPSEAPFPWAPLDSAAFRPKQYNLTISSGRFIEPFDSAHKMPYPIFEKYRNAPRRCALQLVFDVSPYPPREEWSEQWQKKNRGTLEYQRYWDKKEFVRGHIARKDETWAEYLGLDWWLSPTKGSYAS